MAGRDLPGALTPWLALCLLLLAAAGRLGEFAQTVLVWACATAVTAAVAAISCPAADGDQSYSSVEGAGRPCQAGPPAPLPFCPHERPADGPPAAQKACISAFVTGQAGPAAKGVVLPRMEGDAGLHRCASPAEVFFAFELSNSSSCTSEDLALGQPEDVAADPAAAAPAAAAGSAPRGMQRHVARAARPGELQPGASGAQAQAPTPGVSGPSDAPAFWAASPGSKAAVAAAAAAAAVPPARPTSAAATTPPSASPRPAASPQPSSADYLQYGKLYIRSKPAGGTSSSPAPLPSPLQR